MFFIKNGKNPYLIPIRLSEESSSDSLSTATDTSLTFLAPVQTIFLQRMWMPQNRYFVNFSCAGADNFSAKDVDAAIFSTFTSGIIFYPTNYGIPIDLSLSSIVVMALDASSNFLAPVQTIFPELKINNTMLESSIL